jgi:tetratricopeptide (TPR) repeat protein
LALRSDRAPHDRHPTPLDLEAFYLSGDGAGGEAFAVEHLLNGCVVCADTATTFWSSQFEPRSDCDAAGACDRQLDGGGSDFDGIFDRVEARVLRVRADLALEDLEAHRHLPRLLQHPPERQLLMVGNLRRYQTWRTCEILLEESWKLRFEDPRRMAAIARVALEVSRKLSADHYGKPRTQDLGARCWLSLGNARRILGDFLGAERAIEWARSLLAEGTGNAIERANWLDIHASLLSAQLRYREADAEIALASRLYCEVGQKHLLGSALIKRSMISEALDGFDRAIVLARAGLDLIDVDREPIMAIGAWLNVVRALNSSGRPRDALTALERARPLYVRRGDRTTLLRFQWAEGAIAHALGRDEQAEGCLGEAREGFLRVGTVYEAALISLDLAGLLAAQGRYAEVRGLASELMEVFVASECRTEALAARLLLLASERERVSRSLLDRIAASLRRSRSRG